MTARDLRNCLGQFATGVTVVTWMGEDHLHYGVTVNAFTSVSMDPALVLISIDRNANACKALKNRSFVINILSAKQEPLARQFAGKPQQNLQIEWEYSNGVPKLRNSLATIQCTPWKEYDGGDHVLYIGKVEDFIHTDKEGLVFFQGKFMQTKALEKI
ncbi:flavin reductase family protein [Virgibacillus ihumii]|uniref:flavin reductase family protein n=1 Tax=Virgibacillus ihumii TaxID=2686091 RepID=UPI00157BCE18|nr:flavin reductase family protein [Virgibacillus ihumii]